MSLDVRFIEPAHRDEFHSLVTRAFGGSEEFDQVLHDRWEATFRTDLCIGAFDGDRLVGTFSSHDLDLSLPGAEVPMAGTTIVTVEPSHRRRGLLTRMMRMHLDQARERNQPCAGLWATSSQIYDRFGYGVATLWTEASFDTRRTSVSGTEDGVSIRLITTDEAKAVVPGIFDNVFRQRPGMISRNDAWWKHRIFLDHPSMRGGMSALRWVVAERDSSVIGYAAYRQKTDWDHEGGNGKTNIVEMMPGDDAARRALWHYLSHVDLYPNVTYWNMPADDPLPWLLDNPRLLTIRPNDSLWLRILDVAQMFEARHYVNDGAITLGVKDPIYDDIGGTYRLEITGGRATVERSDRAVDVELGISELGSVFFGSVRARSLAAANRVTGGPTAVDALDRLLAWPAAPWTQEIF